MNKFADETFEGVEVELPDPAEELRQKTVEALYAVVPEASEPLGGVEPVVFNRETGEVQETEDTGSGLLVKPVAKVRCKRTEAQMIASLGGSALKEATYVADRIAKLEDKISELLGSVSQKARENVLNDYPHLSRY